MSLSMPPASPYGRLNRGRRLARLQAALLEHAAAYSHQKVEGAAAFADLLRVGDRGVRRDPAETYGKTAKVERDGPAFAETGGYLLRSDTTVDDVAVRAVAGGRWHRHRSSSRCRRAPTPQPGRAQSQVSSMTFSWSRSAAVTFSRYTCLMWVHAREYVHQ
ncbi:hypothetical protein Slala05_70520 [Streptomyces lavendulae subsp. lavendulae]|nr:hypothetical protein Slala05_70520 [Streptomyces lavendulae subsp. lavendulae]